MAQQRGKRGMCVFILKVLNSILKVHKNRKERAFQSLLSGLQRLPKCPRGFHFSSLKLRQYKIHRRKNKNKTNLYLKAVTQCTYFSYKVKEGDSFQLMKILRKESLRLIEKRSSVHHLDRKQSVYMS